MEDKDGNDINSNSNANNSFSYKTNISNSLMPRVVAQCTLTIEEGEGRNINEDNYYINDDTFSSLSLCFGFRIEKGEDNSSNASANRTEYIGIRPATRINFSKKNLSDTSSYEITYKIYF